MSSVKKTYSDYLAEYREKNSIMDYSDIFHNKYNDNPEHVANSLGFSIEEEECMNDEQLKIIQRTTCDKKYVHSLWKMSLWKAPNETTRCRLLYALLSRYAKDPRVIFSVNKSYLIDLVGENIELDDRIKNVKTLIKEHLNNVVFDDLEMLYDICEPGEIEYIGY